MYLCWKLVARIWIKKIRTIILPPPTAMHTSLSLLVDQEALSFIIQVLSLFWKWRKPIQIWNLCNGICFILVSTTNWVNNLKHAQLCWPRCVANRVRQYLNTIVFKYVFSYICVFINVFINTVCKYFLVYLYTTHLNALNGTLSALSKVWQSHVSWCSVHRTSNEHVSTYTIGIYSTLLFYPLYTILNYYS